MRIALVGATGMIGQRILAEALSRGHQVTAIARDPSKVSKRPNIEVKTGDVLKPETLAPAVAGNDVVVCAFGPGQTGDPQQVVTAAHSLINGIGAASRKAGKPIRFIVVGGAASLEVAPGKVLLDSPDFPAAWKPIASAARDALNVYRTEGQAAGVDWTFFSPAAFIQPGTRTGKYRTGT